MMPVWQVGRADVGEVAFLRRVDVRGLDLDAIVAIEKGKILLYPENLSAPVSRDPGAGAAAAGTTREAPAKSQRRRKGSMTAATLVSALVSELPGAAVAAPPKPPPGEGLNVPAMLTFRRMLVKQRDDAGAVGRCSFVTPLPGLCIAAAHTYGIVHEHVEPCFAHVHTASASLLDELCQPQLSLVQKLSVCSSPT